MAPFVCCASTVREEEEEVYSENAKEMGTGSEGLGITGKGWSADRRQLPRKMRRHRSGNTEAGWHDMAGVRRTKENSKSAVKMETEWMGWKSGWRYNCQGAINNRNSRKGARTKIKSKSRVSLIVQESPQHNTEQNSHCLNLNIPWQYRHSSHFQCLAPFFLIALQNSLECIEKVRKSKIRNSACE